MQKGEFAVDASRLKEDAEKSLFNALTTAEAGMKDNSSIASFITEFSKLIAPVNQFFDAVLVMDEDKATRENRLGLLQRVAGLGSACADLSSLEGF
jgi:glycyl-tRNA synthetase beta subunit